MLGRTLRVYGRLIVFLLLIAMGRSAIAQRSIRIISEGGDFDVPVSAFGGVEPWIEVRLDSFGPVRLEQSDFYALLGSKLVGVKADSFALVLNTSTPGSETPSRWSHGLCLDWGAVFGLKAIGGESAQYKQEAIISAVNLIQNKLRIEVTTYSSQKGAILLSSDLEVLAIELDGESIPVFAQPGAFSKEGRLGAALSRETLQWEGKKLTVWQRLFNIESRVVSVNKSFLGSQEHTWIGPHTREWVVVDGELWGVAPEKGGRILARKAVRSEVINARINGNTLLPSNIVEIEERCFSNKLFSVKELTGLEFTNVNIHGLRAPGEGRVIIDFSGTGGERAFKGEALLDLTSRE